MNPLHFSRNVLLRCSFGMLVLCALTASPALVAQEEIIFSGRVGDSQRACDGGRGYCRVIMMLRSAPTTPPANENDLYAKGQLSMQGGQMLLSITGNISKKALRVEDVPEVPLDEDASLPTEKARRLGFSSITLHRGRYAALVPGVFPVQAQYSFGLTVAPNPTSFPARIRFEAHQPLSASLLVFDQNGKQVATLATQDRQRPNTTPEYLWDGKTREGGTAPRGAYLVELRVSLPGGGSFAEVQRLVIE